MTMRRPICLAVLAAATLVAASGCRTAGMGNLAGRDALPSRSEESAVDLLVEHNRNAERVQSLEAAPSVSSANRGATGGLHGRLALELPRNFMLELGMPISGQTVANIGSNDKEFWFWAKDTPDKAVYYCNYDDSGASPISAAGLQPDWIIEALGLRVISDEEAAKIKVKPGKEPGTVILTEPTRSKEGDSLVKETVLEEATGRIREHWVYAADGKTPLAHAVVNDYQESLLPGQSGPTAQKVYLPRKLRLEWMQQEKMALDVTMAKIKINPKFDADRREALFVEPNYNGYARINLERTGIASRNPEAQEPASTPTPNSIRETLPAPPPRIHLSEPTPLGLNGNTKRPSRRDPADLSPDLLPPSYARGIEEVVGPPIPTIAEPGPQYTDTRTGWRGAMDAGIER